MDQFEVDINKWADKTEKTLINTNKAALVELNRRVIMSTPVDKGQHRGSWSAGSNSMVFVEDFDKVGTRTLSRANRVARQAVGGIYYLSNNAPAIRKLEYGEFTSKPETEKTINGYSKQAPTGMVRLAFKQLKQEIDSVKTK